LLSLFLLTAGRRVNPARRKQIELFSLWFR
jgi:hypothetical protein